MSQHIALATISDMGSAHTWALDVADDGTGLVVHELDAALSDTTTGA
jgi:hypothetical protein